MHATAIDTDLGQGLPSGSPHYRAFVGPPDKYDLVAAMQFSLLAALGLREWHYLLDIGCGSLRAGRLFIPYLLPARYYGIEPETWLVEEGIRRELGQDQIVLKRPSFRHDARFDLAAFGRSFDFVIAQSIFSHASQAQIGHCLRAVRSVMAPKGVFAATYVEGTDNYSGDAWVYPGCVKYASAFFRQLVENAGLACFPLRWKHPNGQKWLAIVHPGNGSVVPEWLHGDGDYEELLRAAHNCRKQLNRLESHPYIRVGRLARKCFRWAQSPLRRIA